jgi:hypothetical protein
MLQLNAIGGIMQKHFLALILVFALLAACSPKFSTQQEVTIEAVVPTATKAATKVQPTNTPEPTATPEPIAVPLIYPGFQDKSFSSVCINVDINEPEGSTQSEAIFTAVNDLVEAMGMSVKKDVNCEVAFEVTGALVGKNANYEDCGRLYTGANFRGKLIMKIPTETTDLITLPLNGTNETSDYVLLINPSDCDNLGDEVNAPFSDIWQKPIFEGFSKIYGTTALGGAFLVSALRSEAEQAIEDGDFKPEEILPVLQNFLGTDDENLIDYALSYLNEMHDQASPATSAIIPLLSHQNKNLAAWAARTLGSIGPGAIEAIPALLTAIDDSDSKLGANAALAIGEIGQPSLKVLETLVNHLFDNDSMMEVCQSSLKKLTDNPYESPDEWKAWWADCSKSQSCISPIATTPTPKRSPVPLTFNNMNWVDSKICLKSSASFGTIDLSNEINQLAGLLFEAMGMEVVQSELECTIGFAFFADVDSITCTRAELSPGGRLDLMLPTTDHALETVQLRRSLELPASTTDCIATRDILATLIFEGFKEYYGDPVIGAAKSIRELHEGLVRLGISN